MGYGVYTQIIREIAFRLDNAYTNLGLKSLQIMPKEERLQPDMMPYVLISPDPNFINESYSSSIQQGRKDATMNLVVWVGYSILNRDSDNFTSNIGHITDFQLSHIIDNSGFLLASDDGTGFLTFLERFLDALHTTTDNESNPQLVSTPTRSMGVTIQNVVKNNMSIEAEILLSIQTQPFVLNNRQNA